MNASTASRHLTGRQASAVLVTAGLSAGLVAALLATTTATSAAAPTRFDGEGGPGLSDTGHLVQVVCFTIPHEWNAALDGPLPRCYQSLR